MPSDLIPDVQFSDNTNQRTPCVLVLDGSTSMTGDPINSLNQGLLSLEKHLKDNPMTALRVQILIIVIGQHDEATIVQDWCDAIDFSAPAIEANGTTPLGKGMALALDKIAEQKQNYDSNGISSTRPWIIAISDGEPNDHGWEQVAEECRDQESQKKVVVFPIGTESADMEALSLFSNKEAKKLKGLQFDELFVWLSRSMATVSSSAPGETVQLPAASWSTLDN